MWEASEKEQVNWVNFEKSSWEIDFFNETVKNLFSWASKSLHMVTAATKLKDACSLEENLWET